MIPFPTYYTQNRTVQTRQALFKSSRRPHARAGIKYLTPKNKAMCLPVSFTRFIYNEGFDRAVRNAACQKADFFVEKKDLFRHFPVLQKTRKVENHSFSLSCSEATPAYIAIILLLWKKSNSFSNKFFSIFWINRKNNHQIIFCFLILCLQSFINVLGTLPIRTCRKDSRYETK